MFLGEAVIQITILNHNYNNTQPLQNKKKTEQLFAGKRSTTTMKI